MEDLPTWELIAGGLLMVALVFFSRGGVKKMLKDSEDAPKDWMGFLLPMAFVVIFVVLVIAMLRG